MLSLGRVRDEMPAVKLIWHTHKRKLCEWNCSLRVSSPSTSPNSSVTQIPGACPVPTPPPFPKGFIFIFYCLRWDFIIQLRITLNLWIFPFLIILSDGIIGKFYLNVPFIFILNFAFNTCLGKNIHYSNIFWTRSLWPDGI